MAVHNTVEERELIKLIEKMPFSDEKKQTWIANIRENGLTEDLIKELQQQLAEHEENDPTAAQRARQVMQLNILIRSWRLAAQKKVFKR